MREFLEADFVDCFAQRDEFFITLGIGRCQAQYFGPHGIGITRAIELRTIVEMDSIEGRDRMEQNIIRQPPAGKRPEFLQQKRRGDDRRPGIEGETVLSENRGTAAGLRQMFEHGDPVAARAQADRSRKPAKAAADDHRMRPRIADRRQCLNRRRR